VGQHLRAVVGAVAAVAVMLGAGGARAAEEQKPAAEEEKAPNTGRVSLTAGVDFPTDYYFRGILQEDHDYIVQPYGEVTFKLLESKGPLTGVALTLGSWNSLHGGPTGTSGPNADPKIWYESDFYTKVTTTWFEDLTAGVVYTAYMSPNDRFQTVQELGLGLSYNDAKLLGPFALNPSLFAGFEMKGQADAGLHRGGYLQVGIAPGVTLFEKGPVPVSVSLPLQVGLSLYDYYEFGTGNDDTFGFFSGGPAISVPLKFIPAAFGSWQLKGSLTWLHLGSDNLKNVNNGDRDEVIGSVGIAFTY
jgi:hypothetical protein